MMHVSEINSEDVMVLVVKTGLFYRPVYLKTYVYLCIKVFVVAKKIFKQKLLRKKETPFYVKYSFSVGFMVL